MLNCGGSSRAAVRVRPKVTTSARADRFELMMAHETAGGCGRTPLRYVVSAAADTVTLGCGPSFFVSNGIV